MTQEELARIIEQTQGNIKDLENGDEESNDDENEENDSASAKKEEVDESQIDDDDEEDIEKKYGLDTYDDEDNEDGMGKCYHVTLKKIYPHIMRKKKEIQILFP